MSRSEIIRPIMFGLVTLFACSISYGQSTISNDPFELTYGSGPLGVLLPSYNFGTDAGGDPAFRDDLDNLGGIWEVKAIRRFLGTRTSFEATGFFGWVEANTTGSSLALNMPNPADGSNNALGARPTHLESTLYHYGTDLALRDTWRTRFGGLSAGAAFSYMAFDQDFTLDRTTSRFIEEDLDTDLVGGKGFVGWDGLFLNRRTNIDLAFGYYDLETEYRYSSVPLAQSFALDYNDEAYSVEVDFTTRFCLRGFDTGLKLNVMYISDLPQINHNVGAQATIGTDDAVLLTGQLEIRL